MSSTSTSSPLLEKSLSLIVRGKILKKALIRFFIHSFIAIAIYLDIVSYGIIYEALDKRQLIHDTECLVCGLFSLLSIYELLRILFLAWPSSPIELSMQQMKLLGILDNDKRFKLSSGQKQTTTTPAEKKKLLFELSSQTPSPRSESFSGPLSLPVTPSSSFTSSHSLSNSNANITSFHSNQFSLNSSFFGRSLNSSSMNASFGLAALFQDSPGTSMRQRRKSPLIPSDITDAQSLQEYLRTYEEKQYMSTLMQSELSSSTHQRPSTDLNQSDLKRFRYQTSSFSPEKSATANSADRDSLPVQYANEKVWESIGIHRDALSKMRERMRKWLALTVVKRVVEEIDKINAALKRIGCEDQLIGEVNTSVLRQLSVTKQQFVPTLAGLIPFLEASPNHEYLIMRLQELARGGCLGEFSWASGGRFKNRDWSEHLPTDAAIVTHLFCAYMDSRLPANPRFPDGTTFSSQHFLKAPNKPNMENDSNLIVYESQVNPPHYKLVVGKSVYSVEKGLNNLFDTLILFVYFVRIRWDGVLERVNLDASGINILRVIGC